MTTLYDAPAAEFIAALADHLAEEDAIEEPDWATVATASTGKELPPEQEDFWITRGASLLRTVAMHEPVGVGSLRTKYGSSKQGSTRYRVRPNHSADGSGNIIRTLLQQLGEAGYVETAEGEGRVVTAEGRSLVDEVATDVLENRDDPGLERYA